MQIRPTTIQVNQHATGYVAATNTFRVIRRGLRKPTYPIKAVTDRERASWIYGFARYMQKHHGFKPIPRGCLDPLTARQLRRLRRQRLGIL